MTLVRDLALGLRFLLKLAAIATIRCWGPGLDAPTAVRVVAGIAAPLVVIIVWGAVVSRRPRLAVPGWLRLLTEGLVWLVAIAALPAVARPGWRSPSQSWSSSICSRSGRRPGCGTGWRWVIDGDV